MRKRLISFIIISLFLNCIFHFTFSQQKKDSFFLLEQNFGEKIDIESLEREIEKEKIYIKNSRYIDELLIFFAVAEENVNILKEEDKERALSKLDTRYMGEGRCDKIKDESKKLFCIALSSDCEVLSGWKKNFCKAWINKDVNSLLKILDNSKVRKEIGGETDKEDILKGLAIYYGFKYYSPIACKAIFDGEEDYVCEKVGCQVMFSSEPEETIEKIIRDLAIFNLSRKKNKRELCRLIKNVEIREKCFDPSIKKLEDFW